MSLIAERARRFRAALYAKRAGGGPIPVPVGTATLHDPATTALTQGETRERASSKQRWWQKLGPGLITGAADDDPSGIATYSQGGAQFGYDVAWTVIFTYPLMVAIQLASARIGRITGKGLTESFFKLWPRPAVYGLVSLLVLANVINLGADLNAMGDCAALVIGGSGMLYAIGFGVVSLLLQVFLPYERYVRILKWLTLSLFSYVGVALVVGVDWPTALKAIVVPHVRMERDYITTLVAILGTTISPYLFFWQAAQEVEEIKRVAEDKPLRIAPRQARHQLRRMRIDTVVGMGVSNLIAFFMIVATAATLHAQGTVHIETTAQAAQALKPIAGNFAFWLFGIGIVTTGLLALPVLAGSSAYAVATLFRLRKGLDLPPAAAKPFYLILAAAMLIGLAIGVSGIDPIQALFWSAVINAVIAVPMMVAIMLAANDRRIVGNLLLPRRWTVLGWLATVAMGAATFAMFASMMA